MTVLAPAEPRTLTVLKALANDLRFDMIRILARGERCVCDLEAALDLPQSKVSYHLGVLRDAGLVASEPRGRNAYYRLLPEPMYGLGGDVLREVYLTELPEKHQFCSLC
ncbi:ArsR/SmtB family transcription factor [Deinococcus pimensis]|uniref:ArsR/SmtB family transcription factor n=1 Tax=Deinococcus pimensis TaxID=309888 RepID=UPI000487C628|nr:metalloregulator ArsR/SmtB family transcription factor [Deinococcus pimensis]